jgi:hypothetical protein
MILISTSHFLSDFTISYVLFYVLLSLVIIGLVIFFVLFIVISLRKWRQLKVLRWSFVWLSIFFILLVFFGNIRRQYYWHGSIPISVENRSGMAIDFLQVYGRHDNLELQDLQNGQTIDSVFYGHAIDYDARNSFENRIYMRFQAKGKWHDHIVAGKWVYFNNSLLIRIHAPDSVNVDLW